MDNAIKQKWVKALRGREYRQARGALMRPDGRMCCLGVLCTIQGFDLKKLSIDDLYDTNLPRGFGAGLKPNELRLLAEMNDGGGEQVMHSFKEIADYIDRYL